MRHEFEVGQPVIVHSGGRHSYEGKIVKIGRTLVHIVQHGWSDAKATTYLIDTRQRRDGMPGWFETVEQNRQRLRLQEAAEALRERGLERTRRGRDGFGYTADQIEQVVSLIDSWTTQDD